MSRARSHDERSRDANRRAPSREISRVRNHAASQGVSLVVKRRLRERSRVGRSHVRSRSPSRDGSRLHSRRVRRRIAEGGERNRWSTSSRSSRRSRSCPPRPPRLLYPRSPGPPRRPRPPIFQDCYSRPLNAGVPLKLEHIRNFCIVAHIDHGKSTLADRLIEATGALDAREMKEQVLDTLDLERERGITIKLNAVRMSYDAREGRTYELNLIDTPGHVDFTYEVSRSLAACEGAILVVDASQGIQAQTLSNLFLALDAGLEIIPVLNKIDLPGAAPDQRAQEIHDLIGTPVDEILRISAKEGIGIDALLERIVAKVPPPVGNAEGPLRALIFDSYYDRYRGAIPSIRVVDGTIAPGMKIAFGASDATYEVIEVGYRQLRPVQTDALGPGEVGYVVANVRAVRETRVGDTIFDADHRAAEPLPGYKDIKSMVFAGLYPTDPNRYEDLRDALERLQLNDASLHYEPETSTALGFGFRCGFLGLLHMEIVQERLEREYELDLVTTVPNVEYHVHKADGTMMLLENPSAMPHGSVVVRVEEPYVKARIVAPADYIGAIMQLGTDRRGVHKNMHYDDSARVEVDG